MGNFNKKYIIEEAESILNKCGKQIEESENNVKYFMLKNKNKVLKRKNIIWKISTIVLAIILIIAIII